MRKTVEMDFEFQAYIPEAPHKPEELYGMACRIDKITIDSWRDQWISQTTANHAKYGPFKESSLGSLYEKYLRQPAIVIGSGPSLSKNVEHLKDTKGIVKLSCLHNFHYLEDNDAAADYYVSLDAGEIAYGEMFEGGKKTPEEYLEISKNRTLLAFIGSHPNLTDKWKGKVLWFNAPIPDPVTREAIGKLERFEMCVSNGGNVLGACTYIAKAVLGCNPTIFVGADLSFSYIKKFHAWDSKYDKMGLGNAFKTSDVFGIKVYTWQSYYNFKSWFDWLAIKIPGIYINATEGGILGAYNEGNIAAVKQMALSEVIQQFSIHEKVRDQALNPETAEMKVLF